MKVIGFLSKYSEKLTAKFFWNHIISSEKKNDPLNQKNANFLSLSIKKIMKFLLLSEFNQVPGNSF